MKITTIFLLGFCVASGLQAYALNEAVLPLMGDDRLYNIAPVPMPESSYAQVATADRSLAAVPLAVADTAPIAVQGLDMTMTGTRANSVPVSSSKKVGFFEQLLGGNGDE